jgi:hypothetical protein
MDRERLRLERNRVRRGAPLRRVRRRIAHLEQWIDENGDGCKETQGHLDEGTPERVYWHYGYLVALRDVTKFLSQRGP